MLRRINLSAAGIVFICFFLPWVQVSCGTASDKMSGLDLARDGQTLLWLVPILMVAVLAMGLLRAWKEQPRVAAIVGAVCGAVAALLMNRERMRLDDTDGLLQARLTGWFWLSFISSLAIVATAAASLFRKSEKQSGDAI
jgi:hypothetical protein